MQGNRGHAAKACLSCGVLNRIPDCEMRPQIIQCAECGQDIALSDVPSNIKNVNPESENGDQARVRRRTFNKATAWSLLSVFMSILSPFWSHVVNKMFFGSCEIKQKPRALSLNCELGELKLTGRAVVTVVKNKEEVSEHI